LASFFKTFERRIVKPRLRRLKPWRHTTYGDIHVKYRDHLDGGGRTSGVEYLPLFHDLGMPRQARVFEWCAGPGFIGFALLGYGFCDTLCLADVNPEAVEACRRTVAQNRLAEWVAVYHSDNLDGIQHPSNGIWWSAIHRISSIFRRVNCISTTRIGSCIDVFFGTIGSFLKLGDDRAFGKQSRLRGGDIPRHDRSGGVVHRVRAQLRRAAHALYPDLLYRDRAPRRCCSRLGAPASA
jgi:hypothetical protein